MPSTRAIIQENWETIAKVARNADNNMSNMLMMQYKARKATQHMGPSMPLAVHVGERPITPFVFESAGEVLERLTGTLISARG